MTKLFTEDHEWLIVDGDIVTVGITNYAQNALGDIVYVELPMIGSELEEHGDAAVVESVKAASDVYSPIAGKVVEVNLALEEESSLANTDPEGEGWMFKLEGTVDEAKLMTREQYQEYIDGL